jgi:hypothetical protein
MAGLYVSEALLRCCGRPQRAYSLIEAKKVLGNSRYGHVLALKGLKCRDLPSIPRIFSSPKYEVGFFYLDSLSQWFIMRGSRDTLKPPLLNSNGDYVFPHFIHNHPGNRFFDFLPSMDDLDKISATEIVTSAKGASLFYRMRARMRATGFKIVSPTLSRRYHVDYQNWRRNYLRFRIPQELLSQKFHITVFGMEDHCLRGIDFIPWQQFGRFVGKLSIWGLLNQHLR